jgi:hypothetical protein
VSVLRATDDRWHYSDGSHRWHCPDPDGDQAAWTDGLRAHIEKHAQGHDTPSVLLARNARATRFRPAVQPG